MVEIVYSMKNEEFLNDKNQFFMHLPTGTMEKRIRAVKKRASHLNYTFLLQHQISLEDEFLNTFSVLQQQKDENAEAFWLYCYYCATLLEAFYKAYPHDNKEKEYKNFKKKIKNQLLHVTEKEASASEESFIESLEHSFIASFRHLREAPYHTSQIRDYVSYTNLCRVYWAFSRLTVSKGLNLAKDLKILDLLDSILGTHTDVDKINSTMQAPNVVLRYFSVGLALTRFMIDGGLLIRHTFFPTKAERESGTTALERFKYEINKRHCTLINDLLWSTVNFLTNFNDVCHIPNQIVGPVSAVFLSFDVCMGLYKSHLAKQEYLVKKAQYQQEIRNYSNPELFLGMSEKDRLAHVVFLTKQLEELEISLKLKQASFHFVVSGAALLMLGYSATLLFTPPGMVFASFFACTLAVAMYFSTGAYTTYKEKSMRLEQAQLTGENLYKATKECDDALFGFVFTLLKNTIIPTFMIATCAVSWPAALAFTVLYTGYELSNSYMQHNSKKEAATEIPLDVISGDKEVEESVESGCCCA